MTKKSKVYIHKRTGRMLHTCEVREHVCPGMVLMYPAVRYGWHSKHLIKGSPDRKQWAYVGKL